MKFKSLVYASVSGSVGGLTYAHNKGGMYSRARAIPTNPATTFQEEVRSAMTELVVAWSSTLTQTQRDAWDLYAQEVTKTGPLGDQINISGQNWYIGNNVPVLQAITKLGTVGTARVDDGPTTFDRGDFLTPSFIASEASGLVVTYTVPDAWTADNGAALYVFQGQPKSAGAKYFKGPWRLVGAVPGNSTTPPSGALAISAANLTTLGYTISEDQNICVAFAVGRSDGRMSTRRVVGPQLVTA